MKVLMIGPIEKVGGVSTHTKELVRNLKKLGVEVEVYSTSPKREYPEVVSNMIKLYKKTVGLFVKLLREGNSFDIVHVQSSGPLGSFINATTAVLAKKLRKFAVVITFHYSDTPHFVSKYGYILRSVIKNSEKFIVVSVNQKDTIEKALGTFDNKIIVIPNGYDPSRLVSISKNEARKKLSLNLEDKILVNVAWLLERKGHRFLIEAMNKIVNEYNVKNVKCYIIGKGPLKEDLQKLITAKRLNKNVVLLGFVPDKELTLWMNAADLFVLSSLNEGNPTVMFEALGVGLPFVGTKVGGVPEIITSEEYGLLVEPRDAEDLAEKILIALKKEWNWEKIRKYAEQFTWEKIAEKTLEVYSTCKSDW